MNKNIRVATFTSCLNFKMPTAASNLYKRTGSKKQNKKRSKLHYLHQNADEATTDTSKKKKSARAHY